MWRVGGPHQRPIAVCRPRVPGSARSQGILITHEPLRDKERLYKQHLAQSLVLDDTQPPAQTEATQQGDQGSLDGPRVFFHGICGATFCLLRTSATVRDVRTREAAIDPGRTAQWPSVARHGPRAQPALAPRLECNCGTARIRFRHGAALNRRSSLSRCFRRNRFHRSRSTVLRELELSSRSSCVCDDSRGRHLSGKPRENGPREP